MHLSTIIRRPWSQPCHLFHFPVSLSLSLFSCSLCFVVAVVVLGGGGSRRCISHGRATFSFREWILKSNRQLTATPSMNTGELAAMTRIGAPPSANPSNASKNHSIQFLMDSHSIFVTMAPLVCFPVAFPVPGFALTHCELSSFVGAF